MFKDIVVEENAVRGAPIFGEHRNQSGSEFASQVFCDGSNVGIAQKNVDFILAIRTHGLNLRAKLLPKGF